MKITLSAIAALALGNVAYAQPVLWEQAPDADLPALVDQAFQAANEAFSAYMMADVTVGISGWEVDTITTYFTNQDSNPNDWTALTSGFLTMTPKTGALPDNAYNPLTDAIAVPITVVQGADGYEISASGLGLNLNPGDWWIGLTPLAGFADFGQEFHQDSGSTIGDLSAIRNPGGGFAFGGGVNDGDWFDSTVIDPAYADMAIKITAAPAPGALALLGLAGLGLRRRRR